MMYLILVTLLLPSVCILSVVLVICRRQQREAVRQSAMAKMEAFRAAGTERTQMMDFSAMRTYRK